MEERPVAVAKKKSKQSRRKAHPALGAMSLRCTLFLDNHAFARNAATALRELPGVISSDALPTAGLLEVEYDADQLSTPDLIAELQSRGFLGQ
jgi:hypothetical protein